MDAVWQWGLDFIRTVQLIHGPVLDAFFKAVTFLGEEDFFMIVIPTISGETVIMLSSKTSMSIWLLNSNEKGINGRQSSFQPQRESINFSGA